MIISLSEMSFCAVVCYRELCQKKKKTKKGMISLKSSLFFVEIRVYHVLKVGIHLSIVTAKLYSLTVD